MARNSLFLSLRGGVLLVGFYRFFEWRGAFIKLKRAFVLRFYPLLQIMNIKPEAGIVELRMMEAPNALQLKKRIPSNMAKHYAQHCSLQTPQELHHLSFQLLRK